MTKGEQQQLSKLNERLKATNNRLGRMEDKLESIEDKFSNGFRAELKEYIEDKMMKPWNLIRLISSVVIAVSAMTAAIITLILRLMG